MPSCAPVTASLQISITRQHYQILNLENDAKQYIRCYFVPFPNLNSVASSSSGSSIFAAIFVLRDVVLIKYHQHALLNLFIICCLGIANFRGKTGRREKPFSSFVTREEMEAVKRKRQASEADLQGGDTESPLSPKTKKSPSTPVLENSRDLVVILDAGAQYGKVKF